MDGTQALGWMATILFSLMLIPQILKTIRTRETSGVSLSLFIMYLVANIIAFTYAFLINQDPLLVKYFIAILTAIIYISVFVYFKCKENKKIEETI